jgi:hypothetical protein
MMSFYGAWPRALILPAGVFSLLAVTVAAEAKDLKTYELTLKGQAFTPVELKVPAGEAFIIKLKNENSAPAEFESKDMKFEKIVAGHASIVVRVKALPGGTFEFYDEYHEDATRGTVVSE